MDGSTILGTVPVSTSGPTAGMAVFTTATLTNGLHPINATYSGDPQRQIQSSVSNVVNQDVLVPSTVVLVSNTNPSAFGTPVTFTATVTS